jgi:putative transposase
MSLWRLYYHIVWATKERHPFISSEVEKPLYNYIIGKSEQFSCIVHAVNGMPDHIHLVASIPPTIAVAEYIRKIKGSSSNYLNKIMGNRFQWQNGYGVFTVGVKNLEIATNYVKKQKEHHQNKTTIKILETIKSEEDAPD